MLETMRGRLADAIRPDRLKTSTLDRYRVSSVQTPNVPVYSDMTVRKATREGYKISVYVYRSVRTIIQAASAVPWIVLDGEGEPIKGHAIEKLLKNPNPEFSGQDLIEVLIAHLELVGNALWQPIIVGKSVREVWPVFPDLVKPIPGEKPGEWLKGWNVTLSSGQQILLPPDQFIHFQQVDPGNPYWGISPLMAAARTVDTDNEAQDTQKITMQNRGVVDGVFTHEATMSEEQFEEARRQIRERFLDKSRRREPWVLGAGAKWNQMSITPVEMDFIASRLANLRAIAAAFGLDPWWLGDRSASTYNNVMEARKALYEDVVIPLLDDIRSTLNLKLAPIYGDGIFITYDLSGIPALREDFGQKVEQAKTLWAMGVPFEQINSRLKMGFEEFDGWGTGYLPISTVPATSTFAPEDETPEEASGESEPPSRKLLNIETEEAKAAYWKAVDRRRIGWWGVASKKIRPLFEAEAKAVANALEKESDLDKLEAAAAREIQKLSTKWEESLASLLMAVVEDFGEDTAGNLGAEPKSAEPSEVKWRFDPFSAASRAWISQHGAESVKTILATNLADVRAVILRGKEEDLAVTEIGRNIGQFYADRSAFKSMRIARTEVGAAAGFGQREAAKQSGVVQAKTWLSSRDSRVRDSHAALDGEERGLNERYSNGLMFPGDPSGDPASSINCRCLETYVSKSR